MTLSTAAPLVHARERTRLRHSEGNGMHEDISFAQDACLSDNRSVLVVEGDPTYINRIIHTMEGRGFDVTCIESVCDAMQLIRTCPPAFAIIDLRPGRPSGLDVLRELAVRRPSARAVVISGYDNLASAVRAIQLGAIDYLPKPVSVDDLCNIFLVSPSRDAGAFELMSARRIKWEYVWRIYELCDRNVSEAARKLALHRRSLQRLLSKRAPK